jgi:hypothetical protein
MSGFANPRQFSYGRDSQQNGALANYNFTVVTMNYLMDYDLLVIELPPPVFASAQSECTGLTPNIQIQLKCTISSGLNQV